MSYSIRATSAADAQWGRSLASTDTLRRLHDRMSHDSSIRMTISTLALAASAFLIPPWIALVCVLVDHVADRMSLSSLRRYSRRPCKRDERLFLSTVFVGNAAFITPSVVMMASGTTLNAILALFYAMGALLHVTNVLAVHRVTAFVALLAILVPLATVNALTMAGPGEFAMLALIVLGYLLVSLYAASVIQTNSVLHRDLAAARQAGETAKQARERLLAVMSHEMRTPLNAVAGIASALRAQPDAAPNAEHLEILSAAADDMRGLVDDLVDLAAINAGALRIATEPGNPCAEVRQVVATHRPLAEAKGLDLRLTFAPGIPETARISPLRLRQCLCNLVVNAIKYTDTGHVHVHVSCGAQETLSITVEDTGPGIPPHSRERIFESFARLDPPSGTLRGRDGAQVDKTVGIGLGLPIARELARRMGGDLTVGVAGSGGARFRLTVAAPPCDSAPRRRKPPAAALPPDLRALVVDDLATNRIVAQLYLSRMGVEIAEAADCAEALQALQAARFDVVLLDLRMPGVDGAGTLARIRASDEAWADIPVVAMTADAGEEDRRRTLRSGFDGYIAKPVDADGLIDVLTRALGRRNPASDANSATMGVPPGPAHVPARNAAPQAPPSGGP